jgi:hypothetical protein
VGHGPVFLCIREMIHILLLLLLQVGARHQCAPRANGRLYLSISDKQHHLLLLLLLLQVPARHQCGPGA